jgi:hypothetical protein
VIRLAAAPARRPYALAALCSLLAAVVTVLVYFDGPPGVDLPAHLFQTWAFRHGGFAFWNNYWYAGRYEFVAYSVLYYPLAAFAGQWPLALASSAVLAAGFAAVSRREWGAAATWPSVCFAVTAPATLMVSGAYPFMAGAACAMAALAALQRRRNAVFAVAVLATLGFSPLAFALLVAVAAGMLLGQPHPIDVLRGRRAALASLLGAFTMGVLLQRAFPSGGSYPYDLTDAGIVAGFSLAGLYVTGSSPRARSLRAVFAAYLALNLIAFLFHGPIGSNSNRLFAVAGAPLLWLAANASGVRSRRVVLPVLATGLALQVGPFVRDAYSSWTNGAAAASFWRPAERFLAQHGDRQHRVEVVASWGHWEAYYLAKRGVPLARGWFRQDDFPVNRALYDGDLTGDEYRRWLRAVGVRYVMLPDAPLDYSAVREARLLRSGESGLVAVEELPNWTVYELPQATPIVSAPPGGRALVESLDPQRLRLWTGGPGRYLVRVRYSPYWRATPSATCVAPARDGMTAVTTPTGGYVALHIGPDLGGVAGAVARARRSC